MRRFLPLLFVTLSASVWPDVQTPVRTGYRAPADAVIAIGNRNYGHLPDTPYAERDADAFALWALHTRGVPPQNIHRVHNATHRLAIMKLEDAMRQVGEGGTLWVFFSGQGAVSMESGERLLLAVDAPADARHIHRSAISLRALLLSTQKADIEHTVVVGDVSFVGAGRDGTALLPNVSYRTPSLDTVADQNATVWLAADAHQLAAPLEYTRQGLFSWAAIGALRGWADGVSGERDGTVTMAEATRWVRSALSDLGLERQTPIARVHSTRANFVVTEGSRLPTPPDLTVLRAPLLPPLPPHLEAASAVDAQQAEARRDLEQQIRTKVQEKADKDWQEAVASYRPGQPDGDFRILRFVDRYRAIRYPTAYGDVLVSAEQIPDALALLRGRRTPWHNAFTLKPIEPSGVVDNAFQIADAEVTQHVWTTIMGVNPSVDRQRDKPITDISWLDAIRFCNALSKADGLLPAYEISERRVVWDPNADGYRLPTYDEWQLAIGGSHAYESAPCEYANLADASWAEAHDRTSELSCSDTHISLAPARSLKANAHGLHDLTGNVHEWLWDAADAGEDPLVARRRASRMAVGGSFRSSPTEAQTSRVLMLERDARQLDLGFRLARSSH